MADNNDVKRASTCEAHSDVTRQLGAFEEWREGKDKRDERMERKVDDLLEAVVGMKRDVKWFSGTIGGMVSAVVGVIWYFLSGHKG